MEAFIVLTFIAGLAAGQARDGRPPFRPQSMTLSGKLQIDGHVDEVFELFTPLGEKKWVEGWDPEILFPPGVSLAEGMVFRTFAQDQEEIWVVSHLDVPAHHILYDRVEPKHVAARVEIRCRATGATTEVSTSYRYVGLSDAGNRYVATWTDAAYAAKMARWQKLINRHLASLRK